mmetsp:Transcript_39330/g.77386  ORF Transcript_39330/g.77386 Transcript_39330/m.77386 type:complete len:216 (-) Transcript_39330:1326-1973(-)
MAAPRATASSGSMWCFGSTPVSTRNSRIIQGILEAPPTITTELISFSIIGHSSNLGIGCLDAFVESLSSARSLFSSLASLFAPRRIAFHSFGLSLFRPLYVSEPSASPSSSFPAMALACASLSLRPFASLSACPICCAICSLPVSPARLTPARRQAILTGSATLCMRSWQRDSIFPLVNSILRSRLHINSGMKISTRVELLRAIRACSAASIILL